VVVCTYSEERLDYVLGCIESLKKQTLSPKEIILVLDPNEILIAFYKLHIPDDVKIVVSEGYGLSYARNAGVKNAEGEIIAFIDDDAIADKDWLKNLVKNYEDACVLGCGGLVKPLWQNGRPRWFPEELDWIVGCSYKGLPERKTYVRNPIGCNMSFRKEIFEKVGYFKAGIGRLGKNAMAGEEAELSLRILEKIPGSRIVYDPQVVVCHNVSKSRGNVWYLLKRSFYEGLSKALVVNSKSNPSKALSTEDRYLRYLLKVAIPSKLRRIHKFESTCHLIILLISICSVLIGYFVGLSAISKFRERFSLNLK
jgi:glycosyltransferase involved in cell wall biosynthesis